MRKKTEKYVVVAAVSLVFLVSIFGIPLILSVTTKIPYWFLRLPIFGLSGLVSKRGMSIEVSPTVPTISGETITVKAMDSQNGNVLEGVSVTAVRDGGLSINKTTDFDGVVKFEYMGATTVIYASRDGYNDADPKVVPRIPDEWVTTRNYQYVTWTFEGLLLVATVFFGLRGSMNSKKSKTTRK